MGRNQTSTRHVRHVEKGQMLVSTREPRVEALSQVGHLSSHHMSRVFVFVQSCYRCIQREHEHFVVTRRHKLKLLEYSFGSKHIEYSFGSNPNVYGTTTEVSSELLTELRQLILAPGIEPRVRRA